MKSKEFTLKSALTAKFDRSEQRRRKQFTFDMVILSNLSFSQYSTEISSYVIHKCFSCRFRRMVMHINLQILWIEIKTKIQNALSQRATFFVSATRSGAPRQRNKDAVNNTEIEVANSVFQMKQIL